LKTYSNLFRYFNAIPTSVQQHLPNHRKPTCLLDYFALLALSTLLVGCQPKVFLMPTPVGLQPDGQIFKMTGDSQDDNLLHTLYATNRKPYDKLDSSSGYTIFPSDTLELGFVVHSVGDKDMTWDDLQKQSIKTGRDKDLLINQEYVKEMARYDKDDVLTRTSSRADGFFDQINKTIARSFNKDILVYVHGANSSFYRATAMGAQYFHYMGHNSIVLTFSWPSAENLLKYKTDVLHAKQTVPAFARLLKILALHTRARNVNILAYSAGAQVVTPGLAYLRDLYHALPAEELKKRLRIGEVYFAAPDTDFKPFVKRYLKFKDIVERTTINLNQNDKVLRLSSIQNGVSRLGRPNPAELSKEEEQILIAAMKTPRLDVLDVGGSEALRLGRAHDSWYNHPWVSTDLFLLLFFNASPEERGLEKFYYQNGAEGYHFPKDYDLKIKQIINEHKKDILPKAVPKQEAQS